MKLFVAGLTGDFDEADLKEMFELYGEVKSSQIIIDRATGKSKGFGFVDMLNDAEAKEAMQLLDGVAMMGKKIAVKQAEDQPRKAPGSSYGNNDRGGGYGNNNRGGGGYGNNDRRNGPPPRRNNY
ncbi:RNA recognition motif domain-containing protein [Parasediminibacterium paludis]|uniref:RNA recognition motif domain-containing protein n=1 Tax=Parasediminibacterium paludis TaxID=908966 RepID=A0ABV8PZ29_9BACT